VEKETPTMSDRLKVNLPWNVAIFLAGGAVSSLIWLGTLRQDLEYLKMAAQRWDGDHDKIQNLTGRVRSIEDLLGIKPVARSMNADNARDFTALKGD
jgi:hypothetical protein